MSPRSKVFFLFAVSLIFVGGAFCLGLTAWLSRDGSGDSRDVIGGESEVRFLAERPSSLPPLRSKEGESLAGEEPSVERTETKREVVETEPPLLPTNEKWVAELQEFLGGDAGAYERLLAAITAENWRDVRMALARAYDNGEVSSANTVAEQFWRKVGKVGGEEVARELIRDGNSAFALVVQGWGEADPQGLFDYFSELSFSKDPQVRQYLKATDTRELPFIDQFTDGILRGILNDVPAGGISDGDAAHVTELVDYFMENDSRKAESLMREFTERIIADRDSEVLKKWVSGYEDPVLQSAAAQRVIEKGAFDDDPWEAVTFANSLKTDKPRRVALSAAFARLAAGINGHDPNLTAAQLNEMPSGRDRDFALNGFAHGLVRSDPDAAIEWAKSIDNAHFRRIVVENISKRIRVELKPVYLQKPVGL